jgi:putative tricarboxylic transport membrane protein
MRQVRLAIDGAMLALSVLIAWMSWGLKFDIRGEVGPGLMPFAVAVLLGSASLAGLVRGVAQPSEPLPAGVLPSRSGALRVVAVALTLVGAILLLRPLGFIVTTFLMLCIVPLVLGARNPLSILVIASVASIGVYHAFTSWLRVPLPPGVLGF